MTLALIGFVLRRVRQNFRRLLWANALTAGIIGLSLFVVGAFMLIEINLENSLRGWGDEIQVIVYIKADAENSEGIMQQMRALPEVAQARYVSREQAWRDFRAALGGQSALLEGLPREVLPASVEISLKPEVRDLAAVESLAARLREDSAVADVEYPSEWLERLNLTILWVRWVKWVFAAALFVAAFFVVGSTIRLAALARKEEVEIMQLVGASEELIQAPFLVEGILQGIVGAALALTGLAAAFTLAERELASAGGFLAQLGPPQFLDVPRMLMLLCAGMFLGAVGSLAALRRFVRTWRAVAA